MKKNSYVIGVSGASAAPLAERSIKLLLDNNHDVNLILSKGAYNVYLAENGIDIPKNTKEQERFWREKLDVTQGKLKCHLWDNLSASIASGSYRTKAMVIVPCSMGTIGRIASGVSSNLIERCADVHLKENRPLIISPRESPLSLIHLRNLTALSEAGVRIIPPIPSWYSRPKSIEEMVDFLVVRLFDSLNEDLTLINRWGGNQK